VSSRTEFKVEPVKFRLGFFGAIVVAWLLIWSTYYAGTQFVDKAAVDNFTQQVSSETVILEDHLTRSLDVVAARLQFAAAFTNQASLTDGRLRSERLYDLIQEDRIVRSLSLIDDGGRIVASSNQRNVGFVVPTGELPDPRTGGSTFQVTYGNVFAYRDLLDIASDVPVNSNLKFWLASIPVPIGNRTFHWVATVNLGLFENLWERIDEDAASEIAIYDYNGKRISSHHGYVTESLPLGQEILAAVNRRDLGVFESTVDSNLIVAYRASAEHPAILVVVGDKARMFAARKDGRDHVTLYAALGSLLVLLVVGLLFRWYLSYEKSLVELANQAKATGAHVMVSESSKDGRILWGMGKQPLFRDDRIRSE